MKTAAIIAEYNPFHNGHEYQLKKVKEQFKCDFIIVIMSGEFTQRGIPAICNKNIRTNIALECGADIVIELPTIFATGSAEIFANGAIRILNNLNSVDYLVYGTEQLYNLDIFHKIISILNDEPEKFKINLKENISKGYSYPSSVEIALMSYTNLTKDDFNNIFLPNNLLALEYEKQLYKINSNIKSYQLNRIGHGYSELSLEGNYVSSSALRKLIKNDSKTYDKTHLYKYMPQIAADILNDYFSLYCPIFEDDFSYILYTNLYLKIISDNLQSQFIENYLDCSKDLINKISKNFCEYYSFTQFVSLLKSKDLTYNRINRALCHLMLDIKKDLWEDVKGDNNCLYARVLGFNDKAVQLLKKLKKFSSIPIITKTSDAHKILDGNALNLFEQSITASNIYHDVCRIKSGKKTYNEYQYSIVKR